MINPMDKPYRGFLYLAFGLFLSGAVAFPFGVAGKAIGILCLIFSGVMGLIALIMRHYRGKFARAIEALEQGDYLVHWKYESRFWQRFLDIERDRPPEGSLTMFITIFSIIAGFIGICLWFGDVRVQGERWIAPAICVLIGIVLGVLVHLLTISIAQSKFRRLEQSEPEAYIGRQGLYFASNYRPWGMLGGRLEELKFCPGEPPLLEFTFRITGGETDQLETVRVPVPPGEEARAQEIAAALGGG